MVGTAPAFRPRRRQGPPVLQASRDRLVGGAIVFRSKVDGFTLLIPVLLADQLDRHARAHVPNECIGILLGQRGVDAQGPYLAVLAVLVDEGAHTAPMTVRTTPKSEAHVRALGEEQCPGLEVWGWWHTHLRYGAFFSDEDMKNQAAWLAPDACGVVVDPWSSPSIAAFRGPRSEPLALVDDPRSRQALEPTAAEPRPSPDKARPGHRKRGRRWLGAAAVALACLLVAWVAQLTSHGPPAAPGSRMAPTSATQPAASDDSAIPAEPCPPATEDKPAVAPAASSPPL